MRKFGRSEGVGVVVGANKAKKKLSSINQRKIDADELRQHLTNYCQHLFIKDKIIS